MARSIASSFGSALISGLVALISTGCAGDGDVRDAEADGLDSVGAHGDELSRSYWRSRHHLVSHRDAGAGAGSGDVSRPDAGGTGGAGGVSRPDAGSGIDDGEGDAADCAVCARANECCNAVDAGALCSFSADTCASLEPSSRKPYVVSCKTLLDTVASVRSPLPVSCR
jgi:hypothetical protein